jgi:pimeloyl-ACP methyl ester carboxylesterase
MPDVTVNGVRLTYELQGEGEPIVLIQGAGMPKEAWLIGGLAPALGARYRTVMFDNRGVGGSDAPAAPYSVSDMADDTAGLIERLGLAPCRLVGVSLGGFVAEHLAAESPGLVRAAALVASAGPPSAYGRLWSEGLFEVVRQDMALPTPKRIADFLSVAFTPAQLQDDVLVEAWIEQLSARPLWANPGRLGQVAAGHAWHNQSQNERVARWSKISAPLLVVAFENDAGFPPSSGRQMTQAVPGAELAVIAGAGHGGLITHAGAVSEVLLKFFARADK